MKPAIVILAVALVGVVVFLVACEKRGPQADAEAAVGRGEYQFIALLDPEGKWTRPEVAGIPAWYFETTGIRMQQTKPETMAADAAYMKSYNDALTQALKAQGKFHVIEENVARVKANLDKQKQ
jgi:hypothetical protein